MKLVCGDCLEVMKSIPDHSVDMILCDPPYGIDFQSARIKDKTKRKPKIQGDKKPFVDFIPEVKRIIKSTGVLMIFSRWDVQQRFIDALSENDLRCQGVIIWDKVVHGMGDLKRVPGSRYESILYHAEKDFRFKQKRPTDIIRIQRVSANKLIHPNEKPIQLLEKLIQDYCDANGVVLDNCMGSGSTGVACVNTGRDFIGIELDENYFQIAKKRISAAMGRED